MIRPVVNGFEEFLYSYVAAGRLDGFWEQGLNPWDTAAGSIIVREASGIISDYSGNPYSPFGKNIVASNPGIHGKILGVLNNGYK